MSNHTTNRNQHFRNREQEDFERRRFENERRYGQQQNYQGQGWEQYPHDQRRFEQGGFASDEYDTGWNESAYNQENVPYGGDYARGSGGYGRQEMSSRYQRGNFGRSTDYGGNDDRQQDNWRRGPQRYREDSGQGGYQQSYDNRWNSPSQRDDWRTGWQGDGNNRHNRSQWYGNPGQQQSGMGGTYEGDFGAEYSHQGYDRGNSGWTYTEIWMIPGPMSGRGPEGYQRSDDRIKEDVSERLSHHGQLDASNIRVDVNDCEVTLEGNVGSRRAKRMAEDALEGISGVRDIHNRLRVKQNDWDSNATNQSNGQSLPKGKGSMSESEPQVNGRAKANTNR